MSSPALRRVLCRAARYARPTSAPLWITVDKGVLMIRSTPRAVLALIVATIGVLLLVAGIVLVAYLTVVDVRLARVAFFAGITVFVIAAIVGVRFTRHDGRRMRWH
jgi:hypothetical protein